MDINRVRRLPRRVRVVGVLLVIYGLAGLVVLTNGALLARDSLAGADGIIANVETQRQVLVLSLDATGAFLRDARTGTENVGTSLTGAVDASRRTAGLTRSLGAAMDQLASVSDISILGSQPFGDLGRGFADVSGQAAALGASLDQTADALEVNGADLDRVGADLDRVGAQVDALRRQLSLVTADTAGLRDLGRELDSWRFVFTGLFVWLALLSVMAVGAGIVLLRWSPGEVRTSASEDGPRA